MTNVEALQALYAALGGVAADVANAVTIVDVLNAIAAKYEGADDAVINPDAIANIAAVADKLMPEPTLIEKSITANGEFMATDDEADGYSKVTVNVKSDAEFSATPSVFKVATNLKSITIPDGVTTIGNDTFYGFTSLEEVILPESLEAINDGAFAGASSLKEITIPNNVTSIGGTAFTGVYGITITINKAEGSISGAPWNATDTTIIWNG